MSSFKIGILIPTRNDRPGFLENCVRMMDAQTMPYDKIVIVNDEPFNDKCDITLRYRTGYGKFLYSSAMGKWNPYDLDVIALIEDDDYYAPNYLETMVKEWERVGKPDLFGTNYTIYYHIRLKKYLKMEHFDRASAMNTLIKPDLYPLFNRSWWPVDEEPYTDVHLWKNLKGQTFTPKSIISVGIKHGIGLTGGRSHTDRLERYDNPKFGFADVNDQYPNGFLKSVLDAESFNFYSKQFS